MDFDAASGRRLLQALEDFGEQMNALYKTLPGLREQFAPDWSGETADHISKMLAQYEGTQRKIGEKLGQATRRLQSALKIADELEHLFSGGGP